MYKLDLRDMIGGMLLVVFGVSVSVYSLNYDVGQLRNMGPGYFPFILGIVLAILGGFVAVPALFRSGGRIEVNYRNMLSVIFSILVFALALDRFGLIVSTILSTFISTIPGDLTWKGRFILGCAIALVTSTIFVFALGMIIPVWPWSV